MSLSQSIRSILIGNAGILAAIGNDANGNPKFYPDTAPQATSLPFVLIDENNRIGENAKNCYGGLDSVEISLSIHNKVKKDALDVALLIRAVLDGYKGIVDSENIRSCGMDRQESGFHENKEIFYVEQTYIIWVNNN